MIRMPLTTLLAMRPPRAWVAEFLRDFYGSRPVLDADSAVTLAR
jgi:hypothetical protein